MSTPDRRAARSVGSIWSAPTGSRASLSASVRSTPSPAPRQRGARSRRSSPNSAWIAGVTPCNRYGADWDTPRSWTSGGPPRRADPARGDCVPRPGDATRTAGWSAPARAPGAGSSSPAGSACHQPPHEVAPTRSRGVIQPTDLAPGLNAISRMVTPTANDQMVVREDHPARHGQREMEHNRPAQGESRLGPKRHGHHARHGDHPHAAKGARATTTGGPRAAMIGTSTVTPVGDEVGGPATAKMSASATGRSPRELAARRRGGRDDPGDGSPVRGRACPGSPVSGSAGLSSSDRMNDGMPGRRTRTSLGE